MKFDQALQDVVYYRIERTMRQVKAYTRQVLREHQFGVTIDQWILLKRISEEPAGLSQNDLAQSTFKDPAAITRILDQLAKRNLVTRTEVEGDRRTNNLALTEKGLDLVLQMTPYVKDIRALGLSQLNEQEIEQLKTLLDKVYHSFES
jgi:DNA-binding MarR family transcriptional regulator